jgi:serine-type D-Ala-D-Ala carboxypeptidase/endopeptidase
MNALVRRIHCLLLLAVALLVPAAAAAQQHFPADDDLRVMLRYLVEDGATPGIVLGILEADGSTRILSYGSGGADTRPLGPRSGFNTGSIGKTFTGTLLAVMAARGEVALEDPVTKYLPDAVSVPSRNGREITLLDLATHRSGLPTMPEEFRPRNVWDPYAGFTVDSLYIYLSRHELRRDPGAEVEYSNFGMGLLGHALARAAGTTFESLLRERILEPLGMDRTRFVPDGELAEWMTKGHRNGIVQPHWSATEAIHGAGGLLTTAEDMLKYLQANVGPPRTELEHAMREAHRVQRQFGETDEIGLGWQIERHAGRTVLKHGGAGSGFTSQIAFDPEKRIGFVRLTNTIPFPDDIGLAFLRLGPPLDIAEVAVPAEMLARYAGTYEFSPGVNFIVALEEDGTLSAQAGNTVRFRLYAESDSSFFTKRLPRRVRFTTDQSGAVDSMILDYSGTERVLPRLDKRAPAAS